ncbi:CXXC-type zinc finger protein 5 isoform X3 [Taeniopygia guttata]|uniref:CXXC-type zinc finger protein 5 isoform X3 n=1 Tax=Taeniopygia guttata TaxID=59729 RepID=UPI003BB915E4
MRREPRRGTERAPHVSPRRPGPPWQRPVVSRVTMVAAGPGGGGGGGGGGRRWAAGPAVPPAAGMAWGARGEPPTPGPAVRAWVAAASPGCAGLPRHFGSATGARARGGRGSGAARHRPAMCDNSPNFIAPPFPASPPAPLRRQTGFPNPLLPPPAAGTVPHRPDTHRATAIAPWNIPRSHRRGCHQPRNHRGGCGLYPNLGITASNSTEPRPHAPHGEPRGVSQSRRVCLCTESTLSPPQPAREETPR